jgi:hypothetical protein
MHFMPDTEDEDSAAETFWPEGYKQNIREYVPGDVKCGLLRVNSLRAVFERRYLDRYPDYAGFTEKIADMVAVGAENGADDAFDDIIHSFLLELPLPPIRDYANYSEPEALSDEMTHKLKQNIISEYSKDNIYTHAYKVGYARTFLTFEEYINRVAEIVVIGSAKGANDILVNLYRAFLFSAPIIPVRRHPRRLKVW